MTGGPGWGPGQLEASHVFPQASNYTLQLYGGACGQVDMLDTVSSHLPLMGALTFGLIMVIVAVAFRSLVLPFIFVVAMSYTLAVTFGLAAMIFGLLQVHKC